MISPASARAARSVGLRRRRRPLPRRRGSPSRSDSASGGQVGREVAAGAGDGERGDLVLERADVTAGDQLQVGHGALEVEVRVVLPGEADAAEDLDALLGAVRGAPRAPTAPAMRALRCAGAVGRRLGALFAPRRRRVPGHRGALLDRHQHVGQRVLDRLELPDGPAELDPHLGVLRGRLEAPAGDPRALGRGQREREAAHLARRTREDLIAPAGRRARRRRSSRLPDGARGVECRAAARRGRCRPSARGRSGTSGSPVAPLDGHEDQPGRRLARAPGAPCR